MKSVLVPVRKVEHVHNTSRSLTAGRHRASVRIHTPANRSHDSVELTQIFKSQCLIISTIHSHYTQSLLRT